RRHTRFSRDWSSDVCSSDLRLVDLRGLLVRLGGAAPDHDEPVAAVVDAEALDVLDDLLGEVPLALTGLDAHAVQLLDPALVEDGRHGDDALELRGQRCEVGLVEHARGAGGLEGVRGDGVPTPEHEVVEVGEGDEVADARVATLVALTEADVRHLRERSDRRGEPGTYGENSRIRGGGHCAHPGGEDPETAGGGRNREWFRHGATLRPSRRVALGAPGPQPSPPDRRRSRSCTCSMRRSVARRRAFSASSPAACAASTSSSSAAPSRSSSRSAPGASAPPPSASARLSTLAARARAGSEPGMPSRTESRPSSSRLSASHVLTSSSIPGVPPAPGPKRWPWRRTSLSWIERMTSARVNHPASRAIAAWSTTW